MNPPTEQLIRDYLNRLSVAARSRLGVRERQALLDKTRATIEASVGGLTGATAPKVRRALADLGDPIALVEHEWASHEGGADREPLSSTRAKAGRQNQVTHAIGVLEPVPGGGAAGAVVRIPAARRGGVPLPVSHAVPQGGSAAPVVAVNLPVPSEAAIAASPHTRSGLPAGWASPSLTGDHALAAATRAAASATAPATPAPSATPARPAAPAAVAAMPAPAGPSDPWQYPPATGGQVGGSGTPGGSGSGSSSAARAPAGGGSPSAPGGPRPPLPRRVPLSERITDAGPGEERADGPDGRGLNSPAAIVAVPEPDATAVAELPPGEEIYEAVLVRRRAELVRQATDVASRRSAAMARIVARHAWRAGASLLALAMRDKLETLAILLLGVGGAVYPPVWIAGALLAVISPKWDGRDKLLGLLLPVVLVVFGAVMVVALGGVRETMTQYGIEGWLAVGRLARVGAVIGAVYLLRRVYRGRRAPKPPPWGRPPGSR